MLPPSLQAPRRSAADFPQLLRTWRKQRRMSQLALALESGVSQRHVSFLESGRSQPSRAMILQLSDSLGVPLRERNDLLVAAGFAPLFQSRPLDDPQMARVLAAVRLMLANHEPYPALAVDRAWNLRMANTPYERLEGLLGAGLWDRIGGAQRNLLRLFFHPAGIRPRVVNWQELAPLLWQRARREAATVGGQDMQELLSELAPHQDPETLRPREEVPLWPLVPLELELDGLRLSLFSIISTFGTAQDVTADELRIECLFPADGATERLFRRNAPGAAISPLENSPRTAR